MSKRVSNWTKQEEQALQRLKNDQIERNIVDWQGIAKIMNEEFPNANRNPKQCRQKYINHIKISNRSQLYQNWSRQQIQKLRQTYMEIGPSWTCISKRLENRSENCVKNKFNISLRKAALRLYRQEQGKKNITYKILSSMIDMANQLKKQIEEMNLTPNSSSGIFLFRVQIIQLCFKPESYQKQRLLNLIKLIKLLNCSLRCFGIFKAKVKRKYKITEKGFKKICITQKLIKQWTQQMTEKTVSNLEHISEPRTNKFQSQSQIDQQREKQIQEMQQILKYYQKSTDTWKQLMVFDRELESIMGSNLQIGNKPLTNDDF